MQRDSLSDEHSSAMDHSSNPVISTEAQSPQWRDLRICSRNTPLSRPASSGRARLQPCRHSLYTQAGLAAGVSLALLTSFFAPKAQAQSLTTVFTQMDAASKRFQSATADVERDNYERVVKETTVEKGTMYLERTGSGISFGATVAEAGSSIPSRIVVFNGNTLQMYTPAGKQVDVFKAGANQGTLEGYLALGFGGTSQALQQAWAVTDGGPETLSDGAQQVKTEKLVLVSKDPGTRNTFKQITLWLDPTRDVSLKQLFETPAGDRQTAIYTNIKLNARPNKNAYKIPTGKGITVVNH
jgi:outer membrane lipoprotein-sorting protein